MGLCDKARSRAGGNDDVTEIQGWSKDKEAGIVSHSRIVEVPSEEPSTLHRAKWGC